MDGDPDTTQYTAFESSMSPYWHGELQHGSEIVNIYPPSGSERRRGSENDFSNEFPYLLPDITPTFLVGGNFNSVLTNLDATGHPQLQPRPARHYHKF